MNQEKSLEVSPSKKHSEKPSGSGSISHKAPLSGSVGNRGNTQSGSESWFPVLLGVLINPSLFLALVPESVSLPKENPEPGPEAILMQPPRCPEGTSSWLV